MGGNSENAKIIGEGLKELKIKKGKLKRFVLNLDQNKLGGNGDNMKYIVDGIKYLPSSLQDL